MARTIRASQAQSWAHALHVALRMSPHRTAVTLLVAIIALASACAGEERAGPPHQLPPAASDGNLVLLVTNRSQAFDPLDIAVSVDDEPVVAGDFPSGMEYTFTFDLFAGSHSMVVGSIDTEAQYVTFYEVGTGVKYGVLEFLDDDPTAGAPGFTWELLDNPPASQLDAY